MHYSKVKNVDKQTKKEPTIIFWMIKTKTEHKISTSTTWSHRKPKIQNFTSMEVTTMAVMINYITNQDTVKRS